MITDSNFKFQDIDNKLFVILEEFKYKKSTASDLLKLLGGEKLLTSKKYSKEHINIINLKGMIVSNNEIDEKNEEIKKALLNRLFVINFLNKCLNSQKNINESLIKEEPNIIVFCNKLYFSYFNKKQKRFKLVSKEYSKTINFKNKYNFSFTKYVYLHVINKNKDKNEIKPFTEKFFKHTNSIFQIYRYNKQVTVETNDYIALTNTKDGKFSWEVGLLPKNKIQYMNKDYIGWFNKETLNNLKLNQLADSKSLEILDNIKNTINNNKDNIERIERNLSQTYKDGNINIIQKLKEHIDIKILEDGGLKYHNIIYNDNSLIIQELINLYI